MTPALTPAARRVLLPALHWMRHHPGTVLLAVLCGPWLLGFPEPAWGGVAFGAVLLAVPFMILRGTLLFMDDLRGRDRRKP